MSRKFARETVFKLIFERVISGTDTHSLEAALATKGITGDDREYIQTVHAGVIEKYDSITSKIADLAHGFILERLYKTDLAVLILGIFEIENMPDIPKKVTIDECVNLAKTYGTEKSAGFVHGVLASVVGSESDQT